MDLSPHFTAAEFACRCGCGFGLRAGDVSQDLVVRLEAMRAAAQALDVVNLWPGGLEITSGCRCEAHNAEVGGSRGSAHRYGLAADVACPGSARAFVLVSAALAVGFVRVGLERGCVHVDVSTRPEHPQRVLFGWNRLAELGRRSA